MISCVQRKCSRYYCDLINNEIMTRTSTVQWKCVIFQSTQLFFRTNRGTCEEWLMRIRRSMMLIGLHIDQPEVTLRHASAMINEMYTAGNTQVSNCTIISCIRSKDVISFSEKHYITISLKNSTHFTLIAGWIWTSFSLRCECTHKAAKSWSYSGTVCMV